MAITTEDIAARLQAHFAAAEKDSQSAGKQWDKLWAAGDLLPWDRGTSSPALEDTLNYQHALLGTTSLFTTIDGERRRKRALVPGCGRGYDVLLLATYGYDAIGLEISPEAVKAAKKMETESASKYPAIDESVGKGSVTFMTADFFSEDWQKEVGGRGKFEIVYDYTFLCALDPSLRPAWSSRMSGLLSDDPSSSLICLEFPTHKDPALAGPPHGLPQIIYKAHLSHPGVKLAYGLDGKPVEDKLPTKAAANALTPIQRWRPARTHAPGQDSDWISIWRKSTA